MSKTDRQSPGTSVNSNRAVFDMNEFRRHRLKIGMTQKELATKIGVSSTAVHRWENGMDQPAAKRYPVIARILGVDPIQLTRIIEFPHGTQVNPGQLA